ncbi:MAG: homoserine kinase [Pyrinomonadaceae bacterium]
MDSVRVHAPATVSNVVCGFDCLGFALSEPYDELTVSMIREPEIRIRHTDDFGLPTDPARNVAGVALRAMLDHAGEGSGFEVEITKNIKPGSGIGSSSASSCGAVVAANELLGGRYSKSELVGFAMEGEKLASGARHADNVAPSIFGGFTLVRSVDPIDIVSLEFPMLFATVLHPQIEIKTSEARAILPTQVPLATAVRQWSNLGSLVAALARGDLELLARSMEDLIVEPVRSSLIPKFGEVKGAALEAGALGGGISGSGPSMFFLSGSRDTADKVENGIRRVYETTGLDFLTHVSAISADGVSRVR